ncbi:hypothetical protein LXL04_004317 [Taraxacum kok-saghyz]
MGTLQGHVLPGSVFLFLGLWHLVNHIKLHVQNPRAFHFSPWVPTTKIRYFELYYIMASCSAAIIVELFIQPDHHHPFDKDGTIPSNHLQNFEHLFIFSMFSIYAGFAILLDKFETKAQTELTHLLLAIAFGHQLLVIHLHSTGNMGIQGQYHMLLQMLILISFITTLMGIGYQKSFIVSFIRSVSMFFQGLWLIAMGFMLWTRSLIPKGCFLNLEQGHNVVRCHGDEALERAKSLVNIQFSWYLFLVTIFSVSLYLFMNKIYKKRVDQSRTMYDHEQAHEDIEAQRKTRNPDESESFLLTENSFVPLNMEM